jgi:hypothetical protein
VTERKRATGFVLMDAAFLSDAKFRRLERTAESPHDFAAAVGVFWMLLGDARRGKSPEVDWDDYEEYAAEIAQLRSAHLLQEGGFDPEVFERWAPAYRSKWDEQWVRSGTERNGEVRTSTEITDTSGQVSSSLVTSNERNGNARASFMGWKPKQTHDGHHGASCLVCFPVPVPSKEDSV